MPKELTADLPKDGNRVANDARKWLILASLGMTACLFVFFLVAPTIGFPLTFSQARGLLEIVLPVFLGYLGSASHFVFSHRSKLKRQQAEASQEMTILLIRGPVIIFALICACAVAVFGYSNRIEAPVGSGMSLETLASFLSAALGLLAVTTSIASSYLFASGEGRRQ